MLVGHTHDDIDQMFSRFSYKLGSTPTCLTLEELLTLCRTAYTPSPSAEMVDEVIDFARWVKPLRKVLHGHSKPHQFKIVKEFGKVKLYCKMLSTSPKYLPEDGVLMLKEGDRDLGLPHVTKFKPLEIEVLRVTIQKLQCYMSEEQKQSWENFFQAEETRTTPIRSTTWPSFLASLQCTPATATPTAAAEEPEVVVEAKEDNRPLIYSGAYRVRSKNTTPLKIGDWAALESDGSDGLPFWIVKVLSLEGGIKIQWHGCKTMDGAGVWFPLHKKNTTAKFTDVVGEETIVRFGFKMRKVGDKLFKRERDAILEEIVRRRRLPNAMSVQL